MTLHFCEEKHLFICLADVQDCQALLDMMKTTPELIKSKRVRTKVELNGAVDCFEKSRNLVALKSDCDLSDILQSVDDIMV